MTIVTFSDIETTGKLKPDHKIIEASFRVCDLETQTEQENILMRFNPQRNIDAKAFEVHGIAVADLKKEPLFKDKIPEIKRIIDISDFFVFHNGISFDWPYFKQEFAANEEVLPEIPIFDTMVEGTFTTDLGKSPRLQELCWALDVDYDESLAHSGDYDTAVLRDAFFNAIRYGWFKL
jgi:DNA polymerase III subunit epsilon